MPEAIGLAILGASLAAEVGATVTFAVGAVTLGIVSTGLSFAIQALTPKPKRPALSALEGTTVMARGSNEPHQVVYGERVVSGPVLLLAASGADNEFLHIIVALAGHEVEDIGDVWLGDTLSDDARFTGYVRINKHLGADDQEADEDLVAEVDGWTEDHRLRGIAYVYVRLKFASSVWLSGIPNIKAQVKGRKLYDPRTETTAYSANAALCQRDYLTAAFGIEESTANMHEASWIAAANICDEEVELAVGGTQPRYECNGTFTLDRRPIDVMEGLLSASQGTVIYTAGQYRGYAAAYDVPDPGTPDLTADDLRGEVTLTAHAAMRDACNTIRGTFADAANYYQLTDFPPVTNAQYIAEDGGEELVREIELPYTTNAPAAQRLAKIGLERSRQKALNFPAKLGALRHSAWDTVPVTLPQLGAAWNGQVCRVGSLGFSPDGGIDLSLVTEDPAVYAWDAEETALDTPPAIGTPDPHAVADPTNVAFDIEAVVNADGSTNAFLRVTWDRPTDKFVTSGGQAEVRAYSQDPGTGDQATGGQDHGVGEAGDSDNF